MCCSKNKIFIENIDYNSQIKIYYVLQNKIIDKKFKSELHIKSENELFYLLYCVYENKYTCNYDTI